MARMTGSRYFAEAMKAYGVSHIFLVPQIIAKAMAEMEDMEIRRVSTHSELSAVYMADGYARASHRVGVVLAQAVGATNAAAGLREPFLGCSPVVCLTGGPHPDNRYRYLYQQIEDFSMFETVTKYNARLEKVERLPDLLRQCFRAATTGTPGPTHLEIPGRVGEFIEQEAEIELLAEEQFAAVPAFRPVPEQAQIEAALAALAAATNPVIVAGGGARTSEAAAELVELAERLGIPVATSLDAKDIIPDSHPLAMGIAGNYGRWSANQLLGEADLVFWIGSRAGGLVTDNWQAPREGTPAIHLDINAEELGRNYPLKVGLVGDAQSTLRRMLAMAQPAERREEWLSWATELKEGWSAAVGRQKASGASPIRPERLCHELTEFLPANAVVVSDTGHSAQWSGTMVELRHPSQRYIRCAGTLGWGLPGAIGVKCALPNQPVFCFSGDGALYYHLSELETAARLGINVIVIVNNNSSLSQTQGGYSKAYGGVQRGRARELWCYKQVNFARVAEEMGCLGVRVESPEQIRPALEQATSAGCPTLIDVVTDISALPPNAWG
ncbi:MAG: thiamine pyrophosphate-binding protein [Chloroflexota bacterium]